MKIFKKRQVKNCNHEGHEADEGHENRKGNDEKGK